jgi:hypothetical protein
MGCFVKCDAAHYTITQSNSGELHEGGVWNQKDLQDFDIYVDSPTLEASETV